jgi:uncharacterized protein YbbC (DUF1343 family)
MRPSEHATHVGLDVCTNQPPMRLADKRLGLLMNQASVDAEVRPASDVIESVFPGQLAALFSPQHGPGGTQQANMIETPHGLDPQSGLPIYSLYSETRRPTREMLQQIDCLVIDLQDVGVRVYTYIWTVVECLKAAAEVGLSVLILDRPNPLGGEQVEGPLLEPGFESFVGGAAIPMRHALTIGELARFLNRELAIDAELEVIPLPHWSPGQLFPQLHRCWIPPSPNLPYFDSALVYPGQVLLEGTNLSEGRGTARPFEVLGAPWVDAELLHEAVSQLELPGVEVSTTQFVPTFDKCLGQDCQGLSLQVTDASLFRPYKTTARILSVIRQMWPDQFQWLSPPYEYEHEKMPIDIISGSCRLREELDDGSDNEPAALECLLELDEAAWWDRVAESLLYPRSFAGVST